MTAQSQSGRALSLDLGERRIGVAISDAGRMLATPFGTVKRRGDRPDEHREVLNIADENDARTIVVGLPRSLDGDEGPAARSIRREVKALRRLISDSESHIEVVLHDERLSTVEAATTLHAAGVSSRRQRDVIDQTAATVILQSWIDSGCPPADG